MKILVTGARGFVGSNLCASLKNIQDGKDRRQRYQSLLPLTVWEYDRDSSESDLRQWCAEADFVFNLAGINRPKHDSEFMQGNRDFGRHLLEVLKECHNACPVMLSSSIQANLKGRYEGSLYGKSKRAGEKVFFGYSKETGSQVYVFRFPNLYGKWCKPRYNSVIATFCDAIANDHEFHVNDPSAELELLYIDDLVECMLDLLIGIVHRCHYEGLKCIPDPQGAYCFVPGSQKVTVGKVVKLLHEFHQSRKNYCVPNLEDGSFSKKLCSTYMSYVNPDFFGYLLNPHEDKRGCFTEFIKTSDRGQVSVNVSRPGAVKGNHWHNSKWEKFLVVSGKALVKMRREGLDSEGHLYPTHEYRVSGEKLQVIDIVPGYVHSIINLSQTDNLVTVVWANESFDPDNPDTYREEV